MDGSVIFTDQPLADIVMWLKSQHDKRIAFSIINPDYGAHKHNGERITCNGIAYRYHSYRALIDLAEILTCKMLTPQINDACTVSITFEKLECSESFHSAAVTDKSEKYGVASPYSAIQKAEEPAFLHAYLQALDAVHVKHKKRILNLGVNRGDEFDTIRRHIGDEAFASQHYVGIDHSASAIEAARTRFSSNVSLHVSDINALDVLELEPFDLIISIGTLQSPSIKLKPFVMHLVRHYLNEKGAMILGFPNCRWMDGEMLYGAKAPNYSYSEQSLLYNDVIFCKKYLQQHKFRVTLTGKQYLFLTATTIG